MTSDELREKIIGLVGRALDDLNGNAALDDSNLDSLVETIDGMMFLILANGFALPMDVQGFIREGKPLTPLRDVGGVAH